MIKRISVTFEDGIGGELNRGFNPDDFSKRVVTAMKVVSSIHLMIAGISKVPIDHESMHKLFVPGHPNCDDLRRCISKSQRMTICLRRARVTDIVLEVRFYKKGQDHEFAELSIENDLIGNIVRTSITFNNEAVA